jgi:hypothetical protein
MRLLTNLILRTRESEPVYRVRAVRVRTPGKLYHLWSARDWLGFSRTRGWHCRLHSFAPSQLRCGKDTQRRHVTVVTLSFCFSDQNAVSSETSMKTGPQDPKSPSSDAQSGHAQNASEGFTDLRVTFPTKRGKDGPSFAASRLGWLTGPLRSFPTPETAVPCNKLSPQQRAGTVER